MILKLYVKLGTTAVMSGKTSLVGDAGLSKEKGVGVFEPKLRSVPDP